MLNPVPLMLLPEIETGAVPVFDKVTDAELLPCTATLPKLMLGGFALSAPCVPVPSTFMCVRRWASLVNVIVPLVFLADVGANCTCHDALCPTGIETVLFAPRSVNPALEISI
jgi:hypothetical protein